MRYDEAKPLVDKLIDLATLHHATPNMLRFKLYAALDEFFPDTSKEFGDLTAAYMTGVYDGKKQREWVGLTDEGIHQIAINTPIGGTNFARAIEAKLKEKNT